MERSKELEDLTRRLYDALSGADLAFLEGIVSREEGSVMIGTDPNEWWEGDERIIDVTRAQLKEMSGVRVAGTDPEAYAAGSVGWVQDRPRFILTDGKEIPFRLTAVFHLEGGDWKLVQAHASIGVPNEEAMGTSLTT